MEPSLANRYAARRERQLADQRRRQKEAFLAEPALLELERQARSAQTRRGLLLLQKDAAAARQAEEEVARLRAKQGQLLAQRGLPADYLLLRYDCPLCQDAGFLPDHSRCLCYERALFERNSRASNIQRMEEESFESWDESRFAPERRGASHALRQVCESYADSFPHTEKTSLLLLGGTGVGKSFALHCMGGRVLQRGFSVRKLTAYQFFQLIMDTVIKERDNGPFGQLERVDLLILDDLGAEPEVRGISEERLYGLLDERVMERKHCLFASNLTPDRLLNRYGQRFVSRLMDRETTRILQLSGPDLRVGNGT